MKSSFRSNPRPEGESEKEFLEIKMQRQKIQDEVLRLSKSEVYDAIVKLHTTEDSFKKYYKLGILYLFKNTDYGNATISMKK